MKAAGIRRILPALLVIGAIAAAVPAAVQAAGTIAGTTITNSVSVGYSIGGVPGTAVVATATFRVGVRVNMTVTRQNANFVDVAAGAANSYLTFLVTNVTNTTLDFGLVSQVSSTNPFDGTANTFSTAPSVTAYVDVNNDGVYDAGDTAVFRAIAPDANARVFIVGSIPAGELNGRVQAFSLTAVARRSGSGAGTTTDLTEGAGTYNGVDVVFGDGANGLVAGDLARDALASDRSAFRISGITVTKTSAVYSDPFNGVSLSARPIPGAVITYVVTITNPGTSNATNVSISDALGGLPVAFVAQFNDGTTNCTGGPTDKGIAVDPGTGFSCLTNQGGDDNADFTAGTLSVTNLTVNAGGQVQIKYQATVN